MKKLFFALPLLLLVGILSCTDEQATQAGKTPAIYGTVFNFQGSAVKDAEVRVVFDIEEFQSNDTLEAIKGTGIQPILPNPFDDMASLFIVLEKAGNTKIDLYRGVGFHSFAKTLLFDNTFEAGNHQIHFSMQDPKDVFRNLPNGIYTVVMQHADSTYSRLLFYNNQKNSGAMVTTDAEGKFILQYGAFNKIPQARTSNYGNHLGWFQIGDSATLQVVSGRHITEWRTKIEKTKVVEKTFTMP